MAETHWLEPLLAEPDAAAQRRLLDEHVTLLDGEAARVLKEQADHLLRADLQRCLQTVDLLLYLAERTGNPQHRALGLLALANARAIGQGDHQGALALYDEAAGIYQAQGLLMDTAKSQTGKLFALANLGRYAEALETARWAAGVLEEHGQWLLLAKLTVNTGIIHGRAGEDSAALTCFERARDLYHGLGAEGQPFLPRVEYDRAIVLRNLGRFDESIQASQAALDQLSGTDQRIDRARAQQSLAITYFVLGRYNDALLLLESVQETFLADGRQRDAMLVGLFRSDCLLQLRRFSEVLAACRAARGLFGELGTRYEVAQALLNEAVAYAGLGRHPEALTSLAEARAIFEEEGNPVGAASADLERAVLLHRGGQFDAARDRAHACAAVFRAHDQPHREAYANLVAARAEAALGRADQGRALVESALAVGLSRDVPALVYQCRDWLASSARQHGDREAALSEYELAIRALERLRGSLMVEFRADFLEDKQAVYEDAVELCLELDLAGRGLEYAERAKSRALLDLLAYRLDLSLQARSDDDRSLVAELLALRGKRDQLYRRWEGDEDSVQRGGPGFGGSQQQVRQEVLAIEQQMTALWHKLLVRNADYARDVALWQVHTEPIQPYLAPDVALVEYFAVRGRLLAFVVTAETTEAHWLPGDLASVQSLLRRLWLNLQTVARTPPGDLSLLAANARKILQRCHELVAAPLAERLARHARVIVVPHGPLHYLPFHALYDGEAYLLERQAVSYLPAASLLRYVSAAPPQAAGLLAVGHSGGGRLPYAAQEAREVAALMDGQILLEGEATLERLRTLAAGRRTLHLATHGDFRADNPLFSGLALAEGWLTTLEIFNLRLQASLVTLSACQTGRSVIGGGDELLGLTRAFLYAGAASLVLSLWPVEDRSTATLMASFYRQLAAGATKAAALRTAQLQLMAEPAGEPRPVGRPYEHPYFWAPFFLVGDAGPL